MVTVLQSLYYSHCITTYSNLSDEKSLDALRYALHLKSIAAIQLYQLSKDFIRLNRHLEQ